MYGFIYVTTNLINNKKYIGQHTQFKDNYLGSGTLLIQAIKKHGKQNFYRKIIDYAKDQQSLDELERYYIKKYDAVNSSEYYNIQYGGSGCGKENNPMFGKKHTVETIEKIKNKRIKNNYIYQTPEFKTKISLLTQGKNNGMFGKNHTKESKDKMSKNSKGKTAKEKNGMYGKKGKLAINGKKVYQYKDKEKTILINTFVSVTEVLKYLNLVGHSGLYKAIKNNTLYYEHYWDKEKKV